MNVMTLRLLSSPPRYAPPGYRAVLSHARNVFGSSALFLAVTGSNPANNCACVRVLLDAGTNRTFQISTKKAASKLSCREEAKSRLFLFDPWRGLATFHRWLPLSKTLPRLLVTAREHQHFIANFAGLG